MQRMFPQKRNRCKGIKTRAIKQALENQGFTLLYINWKKYKIHVLTPGKVKSVIGTYAFGF